MEISFLHCIKLITWNLGSETVPNQSTQVAPQHLTEQSFHSICIISHRPPCLRFDEMTMGMWKLHQYKLREVSGICVFVVALLSYIIYVAWFSLPPVCYLRLVMCPTFQSIPWDLWDSTHWEKTPMLPDEEAWHTWSCEPLTATPHGKGQRIHVGLPCIKNVSRIG